MIQRSSKNTVLSIVLLLVFAAPLVVYWVYSLLINPFPHYDAIDPEYEYFLNSLAVFKHQPYTYVDHPGTPVEMIGTAILAVTYPWLSSRPEGFVTFHLQNPQAFLRLAYIFMVLIHLACTLVFFLFGLRTGQAGGAIFSAALATMYFAVQPYAFSGSVMWSHNSFSFPFGTLVLLGLYASLIHAETRGRVPILNWIGIGFGVGILAAITIFLASWIVGVLVAILLFDRLRSVSWKSTASAIAAFAGGSAAGFAIAVLPVLNKMAGFEQWIYSILSHQSNYLAVPKDQTALQTISRNVDVLFNLLPALFVAMILAVGLAMVAFVLFRQRVRERPALWALTGGLTAQLIALTLVFLDRPLRAYYFLGVAAILPVLAMALLKLYEGAPAARRWLAGTMAAAVLIGSVVNSAQALDAARQESQTVAASGRLIQKVVLERAGQTNRPPQSLMILWMYGSYSPCWGLWFADHRSGDAFDQEITRICPNQYELTGRVLMPNAKAALQDTNWDIVFTCERYTDNVMANEPSAEIRNYPQLQWACGNAAAVLNK